MRRIMLLLALAMAMTAMMVSAALAAGMTRPLPDQACGSRGGPPKSSPSPVIFGPEEGAIGCELITPSSK